MKIKRLVVSLVALASLGLSVGVLAASNDCTQCNVCRYASSNGMMDSQCTNTCDKCSVTDMIENHHSKTEKSTTTRKGDVTETTKGCQTCHHCLYSGNNQFPPDCTQQCEECHLPNPLAKMMPKTEKNRDFQNEPGMSDQFQTYQQRPMPGNHQSVVSQPAAAAPVTQADQVPNTQQQPVKPVMGS